MTGADSTNCPALIGGKRARGIHQVLKVERAAAPLTLHASRL